MTGIQGLKARLDKLAPPVNDDWLRDTGAYHLIFEESESEQRAYSRMIYKILTEMHGITLTDEMVEERITKDLSTERLRGTQWAQFVTDWSKPTWAQQPGKQTP